MSSGLGGLWVCDDPTADVPHGRDHMTTHASLVRMRYKPPLHATPPVAFPAEFFFTVRRSLADADRSPALAGSLRDAGYHIGEALYGGFAEWLAERGDPAPEQLADDIFAMRVGEFFLASAWGQIAVSPLSEAVMVLDAYEWCETRAGGTHCLVSTGLFAGFFGRFANAPIAVMEVECGTSGDPHCRFLLASEDVLGRVHSAMMRGSTYRVAASREH